MRGLADSSLANLPEPRSVGEVAAIAVAVEKAAARRYAAVARELRALDSPGLADLLDELGGEHSACAERLEADITAGEGFASADPARLLPRSLSETGSAACDPLGLTPYRALAFAVNLAQQSFQLYSYLAAVADNGIRDYAEHRAGEALSRAARLRIRRRRAFHESSRQPTEAYPAAHLVESEADLFAAALAIEDRLAATLAEAADRDSGLSSAHGLTRRGAEALRRAAKAAGRPGAPLVEALVGYAQATRTAVPADPDRAPHRLLADCERAFTFYDAVASVPANEVVMLAAQELSRAALERIRQVRGTVDAPGDGPRRRIDP